MQPQQGAPSAEQIVADLRVIRERSLVRLRHSELSELSAAAAHSNVPAAVAGGPGAVEALLRAAVDNLSGGSLGAAAMASFGLARGCRDMPAQDRRRRAAQAYGVSVERFRKHHEKIVLEQVAEEILKLCMTSAPPGGPTAGQSDFGRQILLEGKVGSIHVPLVVHVEPAELLTGLDVIVVPTNTYLQLPQYFKSSVSAAVRRAGAVRSADGGILADVLGEELQDWISRHGRPGLPVAPGTVAATSSGQLATQGVRRIYHAAIATPRPGTNAYDIQPAAVASSVRNVLTTVRAERALLGPPPVSIGFPLLGAGRGGLLPATSFAWLWTSLEREIRAGDQLEIHFITRRRASADLIVTKLGESGIIRQQAG